MNGASAHSTYSTFLDNMAMRVLMISGDRNVLIPGTPAYARMELQRGAVERLEVVFWGRGALLAPFRVQGQFDVVTVQDPLLRGAFAYRAAKKLEARLNVQVHMDLDALSWWQRVLARWVLQRADSVRVVSQKIKSQAEHMGVKAPIHVLPVFVDVSRFQNLARHRSDTNTLLWLGRFEAEKDPQGAIVVLEKIRESGIDAKLVMLGQGSMEQILRERARGLPVKFPGWQDPAPYFAATDVVISTSRHESYGVSIIEALAAGIPVVAPDVGIAKEAGALVAPREQLAEKVIEVLKTNTRGVLKLTLPTAQEWSKRWQKTL